MGYRATTFTGIHVRGRLSDSPGSFPSNPVLFPPLVMKLPGALTVMILEIGTASFWVSRGYRICAPLAQSELDQPGLKSFVFGEAADDPSYSVHGCHVEEPPFWNPF